MGMRTMDMNGGQGRIKDFGKGGPPWIGPLVVQQSTEGNGTRARRIEVFHAVQMTARSPF